MNQRGRRQQGAFFLALVAAIAASGCTNNAFRNALTAGTTENPLDKVIPPTTEVSIALSRVVKNASNSSSTFDLIGDGSGAFGVNCASTGGTGNLGASSCTCAYAYTKADGSSESFEAQTTYHENDLIRCLYVGIPVAVTTVKVRVHVLNSDTYSNEVQFKFSSTGITLDTASALTYLPVQRYQCRDSIWIPNLFDGRVYDPFQSEDPRNSYPLNFYTTNMGGALSIFANGVTGASAPVGWQCPSLPNDASLNMDTTIFSVAADSGGSKRIYPPSGSVFDRSTFRLARSKTGVFNVPVDAYVTPTIVTNPAYSAAEPSGVPPIGYGATPIPTGVSGQETCPDSSVPIPAGYHWVKVWLFRMGLPTRNYYSSTNMRNMGNIHCNPGEWTREASLPTAGTFTQYRSIFPDCYNKVDAGSFTARSNNAISIDELPPSGASTLAPANSLVSRAIEGLGASVLKCANLDPDAPDSASFLGLPGPGAKDFYPTDTTRGQGPGRALANWSPPNVAASATHNIAAATDQFQLNNRMTDNLGVQFNCSGKDYDPTRICSYGYAYDAQPSVLALDDPNSSRYDYLFVVSPPTVMSGDMANPSSAIHNIYTPYRFMKKGDCLSDDPDVPSTATDCLPQNALRNYGIKFHAVSSAGDPPANDPNRPGSFPVCALQPD